VRNLYALPGPISAIAPEPHCEDFTKGDDGVIHNIDNIDRAHGDAASWTTSRSSKGEEAERPERTAGRVGHSFAYGSLPLQLAVPLS
jgi:hypothetical protein